MGRVSFLHAAADARNKTVIASQCSHWRGEESRAPPVADEARRTSGSGQNFGGFNTAAKLGAPQQEIRFWPPCVKGAVSYGGIAAEIGAKNMPPACFLNAPTPLLLILIANNKHSSTVAIISGSGAKRKSIRHTRR